ncbi:uncharacterized protein LOC126737422 [Anthonomus grandis grandis]|uniref:uncharacterized protein LOC126737422 n=1 Tax=Anthonomus grandis grandis TaxID=2921223 RepID=UPI0021655ACD|nr:uncharacterized protein LOC126737422 [Anthonomus grandis grandis]
MDQSFENSLLRGWSREMQAAVETYRKPILDEKVVSVIKLACETFKQEIQVFFMSVDVVETYIYLNEAYGRKIEDPFLDMCVIIFIMSKYFGGGADLKIPVIEKFMYKICGLNYSAKTIIRAEIDILQMLQYKLPLSTALDEMDTFFEKFSREYHLKDILRPLCEEILIMMYCQRKVWVKHLRKYYQSDPATFNHLMTSKVFLPAGILVSAFNTTNYQFILDVEGLVNDLNGFIGIHPRHIFVLSDIIINLMKG